MPSRVGVLEEVRSYVLDEEAPAAADLFARRRGDDGAAVVGVDGPGANGAGENSREAVSTARICLHSARGDYGPVDASDRGQRLRHHHDPETLGAVRSEEHTSELQSLRHL